MTSLPQVNSHGLQEHGRFSHASVASSELSVNSYESLEAGLTIQTREGDVVTLSASQYSELDAYEYSAQGQIINGSRQLSASYNIREITLSSGESFSFSVQGDLSEEELEDIEAIVSGIDEIIGEMAEGDMEDAVAKALSMGSYDSISMYQADISVERSYEMYAETQSASRTRGRALGHDIAPGQLKRHSDDVEEDNNVNLIGSSLVEKIAEMLEAQEEETVARARQPLSQLFDHHLNALEADDDDEDDDMDEVEDAPSMYNVLETAARDIDQMINDMVKDIFKNTLDRMV
ncbi:MAG: hypothetical protein MI892_21645 [Desulfobacterales bacterium]|nr:hypothetical protein [Desulfobacterales bacterium]